MARKRTRNYRAERSEEFVDEEEKGEEEDAATDEEEEEDDDADPEAVALDDEEEEEEPEAADDDDAGLDDEEDEPKPKKVKKAVKAKKPTVRRARAVKVVRMKAVWVVLDNSSKQIETFPFAQKAEAEKFLEEKNTDKKGFYLQMLKVPMEE